jgi:hypothetical protein
MKCNLDMDVVEGWVVQVPRVVAGHALRQCLHTDFLAFLDDAPERLELDETLNEVNHRLAVLWRDAMYGQVGASELPHPSRVEPR